MQPNERMCVVLFDEIYLKEALIYNAKSDSILDFEDYGLCGRSRYVANPALFFMVRGLSIVEQYVTRAPTTGQCPLSSLWVSLWRILSFHTTAAGDMSFTTRKTC